MKKINLAITGCMGRMGQQIIKSAKSNKNFAITVITENRLTKKKINGIRISLNDQGFPLQWDHKIVNSHSFAHRSQKFKKWIDKWNWEPNTSEGFPPIYDIKNFSLGNKSIDFGLASYNFRTTGCNQNCFVIESIIDESAHKANINTLDYRLTLFRNDERHYKLLKSIAKNSYWDVDVKKGQGKGIAINEFMIKKTKEGRNSFGDPTSIVAIISEIEISNKGKLKINKVHCKIDCGICVNPDQVIAQAEGGIMMGISMLLNEEITFENGMVVQSNYDDYSEFLRRPFKNNESNLCKTFYN